MAEGCRLSPTSSTASFLDKKYIVMRRKDFEVSFELTELQVKPL